MAQTAERHRRHQPTSAPTHAPASAPASRRSPSPLSLRSPLIQTKLTVNQPGDVYEQEADAVASAVMNTPAPLPQPDDHREVPNLQRLETDEEAIQRLPMEDDCPACQQHVLQRSPLDDDSMDEPIQRRGTGQPQVSAATAATVRSPGLGSPLPTAVRHRIEPHVGANLSGVRVHTDRSAHRAAASLNARAFTHGPHIFLNHYESSHNVGLMAHESTHVIQQTGSLGSLIQRRSQPTLLQRAPSKCPPPTRSAPPPVLTTEPEVLPAVQPPHPEEPTPHPDDQTTLDQTAQTSEAPEGAAEPGTAATPVLPELATARPDITLSMPEPPAALSSAAQGRLERTQQRANQAATVTTALPSADASVGSARGAVTEPQEETQARAGEALVEALGERSQPSPEIEALCEHIRRIICEKRPPDEESLVQADPEAAANEAGNQLNQSIEGDVERVEGSYDALGETPTGTPELEPEAIATPPEQVETPNLGAAAAIPDAIAPEDVSLDADVASSAERIEAAGLETEPARLAATGAPGGPIAEAQSAQGELAATAERAPAEILAEQQQSLAAASADMAALQASALLALTTSRASTVTGVHGQQTGMVGSEEQMRRQVSQRAQDIFTTAQQQVTTLLTPLQQQAMNKWEQGKTLLTTQFRQSLAAVAQRVEAEYGGVIGSIVQFFAGLPDWATEGYDRAEQEFGDGVCALIREISTDVNSVIAACEQIIDNARQDINVLFDNLPEELQGWADEQKQQFSEQLDGLQNQVTQTRDNLNQSLVERASQSVQEVREEVHALREAAKGLLGRLEDAVNQFLEDPAKFIIEGLLNLLGIAPSAFWAVVNKIDQAINDIANDPETFTNNLLRAIGQGFENFFDNFADHMLNGLLEWLFSGLGSVGVELPKDFSLSSIITFFLQLMGISWERIRRLLAKHIGEENVALIEKAYELIANLIEMGPEGIFEMIKEQLNPQSILDQVLQAAVDFLIEALIKAVTVRVIALFNPVGAIVQAIEAIYKVLKWIFDNAARIFSLIETVVNGIADIIAGNVSGMATAVEQALARLIAPVVDFLAGFLGIGDLPDKIADTIKGFQTWIEGILDRVIGWLADRAKALLRSLGIGEDSEDEVEEDNPEKADQVRAGLAAIDTAEQQFIENGEISHQEAVQVASTVKQAHPVFKHLEVVDGEDSWDYRWEASPGNTKVTPTKKEEDVIGSTIPDTTLAIPFSMMGEAHTLKGVANAGSIEITMASREAIISNGLSEAISELRGMSNFPGRSQIIRRLERAQVLSDRNNLIGEWNTLTKEQSSQLPQGVNTFNTFFQHRLSEIISEINNLAVGNKPITALIEMFRQLNRNNGPYSYMVDPPDIAPYKEFSSTQRQALLRENMSRNNGKIIADDGSGIELDDSLSATNPLKPNIDHIFPKVLGGSNSYSNAMVIARDANSAKRARVTIAPGFGLPLPASSQPAPRPTVIRRRKP